MSRPNTIGYPRGDLSDKAYLWQVARILIEVFPNKNRNDLLITKHKQAAKVNKFFLSRYYSVRAIVTAGFIVLVIAAFWAYAHFFGNASTPDVSASDSASLVRFEEEVRKNNLVRENSRRPSREQVSTPFPFNPNTADSATLVRAGLKPWQARNVLQYRRHGGKWRSPEHFSHLYGLSTEEYERLRPYIVIDPALSAANNPQANKADSTRTRRYPEKLPKGTTLDLNKADTTQLRGIPGIGSYYASKICRYRDRLGGFISVDQIKEVEGLPSGIEQWFVISPDTHVKQINVNTATFRQLVRHPYLSYDQVKVIFKYRQLYGKLHSWKDLSLNSLFDDKSVERLMPYFTF